MNAKSSVFSSAVIFAAVSGVVGLVLMWLHFSVTIEPIDSENSFLPEKIALGRQPVSDETAADSSSVSTTPAKPLKVVKQKKSAQSSPESQNRIATIAGALRVINQTDQPLRVALLTRSAATSSAASKSKYSEPVHWDFAPGEGSSEGLLLSLPQGNLKLQKGDILVAFAQDGSRRYWGPYVVGETDAPTLNRKTSEWQLILQP